LKPKAGSLSLAVVVRPEWGQAASLRTVVAALVKATTGDADAASNAGMVACELAENAIKYGDFSHEGGFDFRMSVEGAEASVEVVSPYDGTSGSFERLRAILRAIDEGSAKEAYLARLAEVAEKSGEVGRLGLLRIAHEVGAQITADLDGGASCVRAKWRCGR
jgi:hypothetical protein